MTLTNSPKVGIVMGSISDWPVFKHSARILDELGVSYDKRVLSAHRTPKELEAWITQCEEAGVQVFIAAAGGAAHLPGLSLPLLFCPFWLFLWNRIFLGWIPFYPWCRCLEVFRFQPWVSGKPVPPMRACPLLRSLHLAIPRLEKHSFNLEKTRRQRYSAHNFQKTRSAIIYQMKKDGPAKGRPFFKYLANDY
jgi:hypothetical protein